MNPSIPQFVVFLTIVFLIYFTGNWYIYRHVLWTGLPVLPARILFGFLLVLFPLTMTLFRNGDDPLSRLFSLGGYFYLGAALYLILFFILFDLFLLVYTRVSAPVSPETVYFLKTIFSRGTLVAVAVILVVGARGAVDSRVTRVTLTAPLGMELDRELRIAFVSDIHLGTTTSLSSVERLRDMIKGLDPHMVLYGGDVLDRSIDEVQGRGFETILGEVKAPLGVYAVSGNHEFFGSLDKGMSYIRDMGVVTLLDQGMEAGPFYLAGRYDHVVTRFGGERKKLSEILAGNSENKPVIVMDHSPYNLDEAAGEKVFLHLSGHTHHGQMFPVSGITSLLFELSYGYLKKRDSHFYVSSGYGTWGPPLRIGTASEVVLITISPNSTDTGKSAVNSSTLPGKKSLN